MEKTCICIYKSESFKRPEGWKFGMSDTEDISSLSFKKHATAEVLTMDGQSLFIEISILIKKMSNTNSASFFHSPFPTQIYRDTSD